jgi:hypothetical protein
MSLSRPQKTDDTRTLISDRNHIVHWGKYKGWRLGDVIEHDPQWILWCESKLDWLDLHYTILEECDDSSVNPS